MNTGFRVLAALVLAGLLAVVGVAVYNAGVDQGLAQNITAAASGAPATGYAGYIGPHWGYGWGGFGFFGIFFWILGFFLIFALLRAIFGWGRWGRHHGHYAGYGGYGPGYGPGDRRREMFDSWHRDAHEGSPGTGPNSGSTPTAG
jgi:hypothetical protein